MYCSVVAVTVLCIAVEVAVTVTLILSSTFYTFYNNGLFRDSQVQGEYRHAESEPGRAGTGGEVRIENCISKEQARAELPEGLTKTRLYMSGTVRSWIHYVDVRTTPGTQKEHMDIARQCAYAINPVFPMIKDFVHD